MKHKLCILLVSISMGFVTTIFAQHGSYKITNGFGIMGGITQYDIKTDNFNTKQGSGFIGGMSATVDIPNKWYNISFGMQLSENHFEVLATNPSLSSTIENVEYKLFAAQIALMMHVKVIESYVTIDLGPMLQYNGKLELEDESFDNYIVDNYTNLTISDIKNISQFNFNGAIGASAGFKQFKLKAQYIYGFTNILHKLNNQNLDLSGNDKHFKGNQSMIALTGIFTF